ncbi:unnamed protein product [Caenorhabditis angaria]|uniref:Chromo domain-containing protein n=1 Tax=Caenorhabditis angaria TaxID=860376 RepID=A0A9P1IN27_9PELO|nr:unnamed protein product [Caenorhabditis angaria]
MSSDDEAEEGRYIVESIIAHDTFDNLVKRAARGELVFAPDTLGEKTHSKYGFLVHWKGYNIFERTWEPESNLLKNDQLKKYKDNIGMTHTEGVDVKYHKSYDLEIVLKVDINNVDLTAKNKAKSDELKEKEKNIADRRTPVIEIIDSVPDLESTFEKEKKKSGKLDRLELSEDSDDSQVPPENSKKNQRRILGSSSDSDGSSGSSPRESIYAIDKELEDNQKQQLELELAYKKLQEEDNEIVLSSDDEEEIDVVSCCSAEERAPRQPIRGISGFTQYSASLRLSKGRRAKSLEMLNERFTKNTELEIMNRTHFMIDDCCGENEPRAKRKIVDELDQSYEKKLIKDNKEAVRKFLRNVISNLNDTFLKNIDYLVKRYTKDHFEEACGVLQQIVEHDSHLAFTIIQALILCCKRVSTFKARKFWLHRVNKLGKSRHLEFMQSDLDYIPGIGTLPESCSDDHSKCTWLGTFLAILPIDLRFADTTGIEVLPGDDLSSNLKQEVNNGPFRDDMFLSCMELGADCQKLKFLQFGYPLGVSETVYLKYNADHVHFVFCQGTSLKRVQQFIQCGFDVNPIAYESQSLEILNLNEWIRYFWNEVQERTEENNIDPVMKKYYEELPKMIQNISERIDRMTLVEHDRHFLFSDSEINSIIPITSQHILHCSSQQNIESNDGENQVNTCVFSEQGCFHSNGLSDDKDSLYGEELKCAEELDRLREEVRNGRGRFVLTVYRVNIDVKMEDENCGTVLLPHIEFEKDDKGFKIRTTRIVPRYPDDPKDNPITMSELHASPGQRIYTFDDHEAQLTKLKPGLAHIELDGQFDTGMSFIVQILFIGHD